MMLMEDIFFSGTFAGETLSLAATQAVLQQLKNENALEHIHAMGEKLISGINNLITKHQADDFLSICGHPSWSFFVINPTQHYSAIQLKSLYIQEMCLRGILINSSHNLSFAHKIEHINTLLTAYDEIIQLLVEINQKQTFEQHFKGELLEPVFKVR